MLIYLDNCCYNRPFDDRTNIKNYLEREAVLMIMQLVFEERMKVLGSNVLQKEISSMRDYERKYYVQGLYDMICSETVHINDGIVARAQQIQEISKIKSFDSLHLSIAESKGAILLTTDKKFLSICNKMEINTRVFNPIQFVMEVGDDGHNN